MTEFGAAATFALTALAFDGLWAVLARRRGYPFLALWWAHLLLYGAAGFAVEPSVSLVYPAWAGMVTAFVDGTLGWLLAVLIGPGHPSKLTTPAGRPREPLDPRQILAVMAALPWAGFLCALAGAALARLLPN